MAQPDSQNDVVDYESIVQILKIPYIGNENEKKIILDQQEDVYQKLILKFKDIDDDEGRLKAIEAGVAEELTNIIESRDLTSITISIIEALEYLTYPGLFKQRQLLYEKKNPYPALFRLLDHQNTDVVLHTITTIGSILQGGIGTTKESEQNPHFQSVEECGGKQKIFSLFQTTSDKVIKDKTAIFIGRLYKARAILDKDMQQSIISHLKSITSDADEWTRRNSALAINYLSQNEDNYIEIVKGFDPFAVIQDLLQPLIGNEEERKQIQNKKNLVCVLLLILLDKAEDNNLLERLTEARIIEALLYYFETQELNMIVSSPVKIFKQLQSSALTQIEQLKKEKKFYPNILRLFRSSDTELLSQAYDLIAYDFAAGADLAKDNSPNPNGQSIEHLNLKDLAQVAGNHTEILKDNFITKAQQLNKQEIQIRDFFEKYGGLKKLIQIFQNSSYQNKLIVQYSIISIGLLHKAVKIPDEIRIAVIDEIKQMPQPGNDKEIQYLSAIVISMLAESEENHNDIIAEGFPNTILSLLTCDDPKVSYQGLTLALNLLYFGSDSTKQKVKQAVPLNVVCQLTHEMDQNDDDVMTAQLLIDWLLFLS
ncbi:MAG: hypothetical protein EZS28_007104 [Streblomastix strix]|uniref:Armadillo-type fold n=1 Tax=Streblomastix strix TaxID=222440 RepID=A0A5J4WR08_9EUKA|nr:MAG: hypothetical protein EZS28_007104 [Streblomastix strix]